ncbi:hypothetical protein [Vibrio owensii]|uniref:hypothetical protein n=1 Tax=Vibrio owensii TaxID=696485 RepID=UPI0018F17606|nr:hypothetical protein [Vibrio owensii]
MLVGICIFRVRSVIQALAISVKRLGLIASFLYFTASIMVTMLLYQSPSLSPLVFGGVFLSAIYLPQIICNFCLTGKISQAALPRVSRSLVLWFAVFVFAGWLRSYGYEIQATIENIEHASKTEKHIFGVLETFVVMTSFLNLFMYSVRSGIGNYYSAVDREGSFYQPSDKALLSLSGYMPSLIGFCMVSSFLLSYGSYIGAQIVPLAVPLFCILHFATAGILIHASGQVSERSIINT